MVRQLTQEVLQNMICQRCKRNIDEQDKQGGPIQPYTLGQSIFTLHHQKNLSSVVRHLSDTVMLDDGRLVMCLPVQNRLLICNTDGSQVDSIHVQGEPWCVIAVNKSNVAVTLCDSTCIAMYDINNKLKLKSISVPGILRGSDITTINNKLVVCSNYNLLIIDHQTGVVVQAIQTDCYPYRLRGSGDRIFYCDNYNNNNNNNLYWYSITDDIHNTLTLPSRPCRMTALQDNSLYMVCSDGSVQNVSSNGKQCKTVTTKGLEELKHDRISCISYNSNQRKLVTLGDQWTIIKVFHEN
ncbi:unnamed protein product [Mytilus coruscus]|uniref:TRIM2_3 n=1 Tax=Mytilus coruscus TaxID=42192 RepID=A0A6J8D7F4_MYTCO|nr:unnamed protein product [Mytilus coruscus]